MGWNLLFCEDTSHTPVIGKQLGEKQTNRTDHSPHSVCYCWTAIEPFNRQLDMKSRHVYHEGSERVNNGFQRVLIMDHALVMAWV